jgi:TonB family protein
MTSEKNTYQLFTPSGCLTLDALKKYQSKKISAEELKLAEDHIDDCEFCSDAIDGIELLSDKTKLESIVSEINENLIKGLKDQETSKKAGAFFISNKAIYLSAAASVIILVGLFSYFQFFMNKPKQSDMAIQTFQIEEIPLPTDENDIIIEDVLELEEASVSNSVKNTKVIAINPNKEKSASTKTESLSGKGDVYQPPMNKIKSTDSGTEAFYANQVDSKNMIAEPMVNESIDIASTQPLEYYIAGITISEKADLEVYETQSASAQDEGVELNEISMQSVKMAKREKGNSKQKSQIKEESSKGNAIQADKSEEGVEKLSNEIHFFDAVGEKPEFPGGEAGLINYLQQNLTYPEEARKYRIQGNVLISFIVEENGEVTSVKVLNGIGGGCDEEAKRVIAEMPAWSPAVKDGKLERVLFKMPISFKLY